MWIIAPAVTIITQLRNDRKIPAESAEVVAEYIPRISKLSTIAQLLDDPTMETFEAFPVSLPEGDLHLIAVTRDAELREKNEKEIPYLHLGQSTVCDCRNAALR